MDSYHHGDVTIEKTSPDEVEKDNPDINNVDDYVGHDNNVPTTGDYTNPYSDEQNPNVKFEYVEDMSS